MCPERDQKQFADRALLRGVSQAHLVIEPSLLLKMFFATSSKQSASSILDVAAAVIVDECAAGARSSRWVMPARDAQDFVSLSEQNDECADVNLG